MVVKKKKVMNIAENLLQTTSFPCPRLIMSNLTRTVQNYTGKIDLKLSVLISILPLHYFGRKWHVVLFLVSFFPYFPKDHYILSSDNNVIS